jgi:hypothetical protein
MGGVSVVDGIDGSAGLRLEMADWTAKAEMKDADFKGISLAG